MNIIGRLNKGENLLSILKTSIEENKKACIKEALTKYKDGELEEKLDLIESNYEFNMEKFNKFLDLGNNLARQRFLQVALYIESLNISESNQLATILTLIPMFSKNRFLNLEDEEIYLIATCMISVPIEKYDDYLSIIGRSDVMRKVMVKTSSEKEQRKIIYGIQDYYDTFNFDSDNINDIYSVIDNTLLKGGERRA